MATYPQSQAYGHTPYPTQTYPQQALSPPNYYQPPPPQHVYYADPNYFRRDYVTRLAQLTVNSRPIIQALSMLAQEYSRYADIVVNCLEQHIRRVSHLI
jgi:pre-mRNA cleavage complex 2 protein Pcf11